MLLLRGSAPEMECHAFIGRQTVNGWSPPVEFRERGSCAMDGEAVRFKTRFSSRKPGFLLSLAQNDLFAILDKW